MEYFGFGTIKPYEIRNCGKYAKKLSKILQVSEETLTVHIHKFENGLVPAINVELKNGKEVVAYSTLVAMPGCCGMCISTGSYVYERFRNKGIGNIMHKVRKDLATEGGFSCMACTDVASNKPQQNILKKNKWKLVHKFLNANSGNKVCVHIVNLPQNK